MSVITSTEFATPGTESWEPITVPFNRFAEADPAESAEFTITLAPDHRRTPDDRIRRAEGSGNAGRGARAELAAVASFLIDNSDGLVPLVTTARMIGCYYLARFASGIPGSVTVALGGSAGGWAMARVNQRAFEIEQTRFGAAHILHEDKTLGLYILEIAPGHEIPAHAHAVMRECELILEDGLLLQGQPVAAGSAFDWPLDYVHAYANPTEKARRILCLDSPRFMPEDEVPLTPAPPLLPLAPLGNYFA